MFQLLPLSLPVLDAQPNEPRWINFTTLDYAFEWEDDDIPLKSWNDLLTTAYKEPLSMHQHADMLRIFSQNPTAARHITSRLDHVVQLVENNPEIAREAFKQLLSHPDTAQTWQDTLGQLAITLRTADLVVNLAKLGSIERDWLHLYVIRAMTSCDLIDDQDNKARQVGMVCMFLKTMMKNVPQEMRLLFGEMQTFCLQFAWVKEAATLYKMLKDLDGLEKRLDND
jgi:hypothetical protein